MSTIIRLLPQTFEADSPTVATVEARADETSLPQTAISELDVFAEEQIAGLVRQVYLAGSKPCRMVVFAAVDAATDITDLCRRVAENLSDETRRTTCLLEANLQSRRAGAPSEHDRFNSSQKRFGGLRDTSLQISSNLWLMSADVFLGEQSSGISASWARSRFAELRLEFDYLVIQAPAAATTNYAGWLARICDGMVLALEANSTRRVTAQKVTKELAGAHVRLLGTVLTERTFPIPRTIYKRI